MIIFFASDDFRWLLRPVSRPEVSLNCTQSGTVEKMTNCGKNRFLQSLRYYTVSLHTYIFFRMVFILSAISSWSDFTHNWVESILKGYPLIYLSAILNLKHLKTILVNLQLNWKKIPSEFRSYFNSLCHSSLNLTWSRLLALFKKWKMFWYWPTISRPIPR